ncbi:cell envelope integrity protein CreD [Luteitalea sp. TBR-22]|uniref:cell envelope integrity protein CreD n=1 Tax=Luteitalea sp. TBR-22 TaxID=2802971 RepID=UPI001AF45E70|nr:cell envelope integrity protein CreD [Luteitalea sp. TBR-22]BCS35384.1 cell envelope integrity protein CreD [Luteitalea sp. TBR-22]
MLQRSVLARMVVMGALLLVLMVPLAMTRGIIVERTVRRDEVAADISRTWGDRQVLVGPILSVPYRFVVREAREVDRLPRDVVRVGRLMVLPATLEASGRLDPEVRARGPFSAVVYTARLVLRGRFASIDTSVIPEAAAVAWEDATVSLGVTDPRGIAPGLRLAWNGRPVDVVPGIDDVALAATGVRARRVALLEGQPSTFEVTIDLRGTRTLSIVPVGNETTLRLSSSWPHPGFSGGQLPVSHEVGRDGFEARWQSGWFARGFPAAWVRGQDDDRSRRARAEASAIGVDLVQPVDVYQQAERAVKYGALFIVLTLAVAFIREVTSRGLVHPVQYLFIGFGLCLFYLLLVSLAEHLAFGRAYLIASASTVLLLSWYWSGVLRAWRAGLSMGAALCVLYGYLYLLLRLEDLALLAGASGLFVMLAVVMAMTRRVDWFRARLDPILPEAPEPTSHG